MLILLSETALQAKQVAPNVYVAIQQPTGTPEWIRVLVSAATGASFGIVGSIGMEFLKPIIQRRNSQRLIAKRINAEFLENMQIVETSERMLSDIAANRDPLPEDALNAVYMACKTIRRSWIDYYYENEKETLQAIEGNRALLAFYSALDLRFRGELEDASASGLHVWIGFAVDRGRQYIRETRLRYESTPHPVEFMHGLAKEEFELKRK